MAYFEEKRMLLKHIKCEYNEIILNFLEGQCKNKEQIKKLQGTILFDLFQGIVHGSFNVTEFSILLDLQIIF